ncbi:hypothetical protein S83_007610, partial [Arachis hypogaea]
VGDVRIKDKSLDGYDVEVSSIDKKDNGSVQPYDDQTGKKKIEKPELIIIDHPAIGRIPKAVKAEQISARWPDWLSSIAGEAIKGWIPRSANTFERLGKELIIVALKKVYFDSLNSESIKFMAREILILRRLNHPNIIKLDSLITSQTSHSLYLLKCYMQQLFSGLDHCHSHGVLHRDIKGSNILIDNNNVLKIADFGLTNFFDPHHSVPLIGRVVTLWYRPPELLLGENYYGVAVDLWNTGCILRELYSDRPILPEKTEVEQIHRIFKLCGFSSDDYWLKLLLPLSTVFKSPHHYKRCIADTFKNYPHTTVKLIETLLSIDPTHRGPVATALRSEFFTLEPLLCDPSSLPKYPPSKKIDAKLQCYVGDREKKDDSRVRQISRTHVTIKDNVDS